MARTGTVNVPSSAWTQLEQPSYMTKDSGLSRTEHSSDHLARATLDALSAHIAILDQAGTIIAVNKAWRAFAKANFPHPEHLAEGANYLQVCDVATGLDAEDAAAFAAAIRAVIVGERDEFAREYPCHSPTEQRWFVGRVTPLPGPGPACVVVAHENITARKLAEERLRQQLSFTRALTDNLGEGVYATDRDGHLTFMNPAAERMLGWTQDELLGRDIHEIIHHQRATGAPLPKEECRLLRVVHSGATVSTDDDVFTHRDGTIFPVAYTSAPLLTEGHVVGAVVAFHDITERKRAEQERAGLLAREQAARAAAEEAEARYHGLFRAAADAILVADREGRYLEANLAATGLLGYTREELLQMRVADVVAAGPEWTEGEYTRFLQEGSWRGELEVRRKDGTTVPVEAQATAVPLQASTVYLSVLRDISDRRAMERMQRDFLAMVTHELKNPLTSLRGYAQLMRRRGAYSESAVDTIMTQALHLERLIGDLLDVSHLEAGQLELRCSEVDLAALARTATTQAQALTRVHTICAETPAEPLLGWWDRDRLEQILQNLLTNAIKYSPDGGEIVVRVEDRGGEAWVAVTDQGVGISPEALPRLFERFYRAGDAVASGVQGLGLGLAISKALVEAHAGHIRVESQPGQGSTFTVALPYTRSEEGA